LGIAATHGAEECHSVCATLHKRSSASWTKCREGYDVLVASPNNEVHEKRLTTLFH
ncbi:hypothetical protein T11_7543, partial [Trichinella zimbabwensis]